MATAVGTAWLKRSAYESTYEIDNKHQQEAGHRSSLMRFICALRISTLGIIIIIIQHIDNNNVYI